MKQALTRHWEWFWQRKVGEGSELNRNKNYCKDQLEVNTATQKTPVDEFISRSGNLQSGLYNFSIGHS